MKVITDIFGLILKFRNQLVSQTWRRGGDVAQSPPAAGAAGAGGATVREVEHPAFHDICATYKSFQEYSAFLFRGKLHC